MEKFIPPSVSLRVIWGAGHGYASFLCGCLLFQGWRMRVRIFLLDDLLEAGDRERGAALLQVEAGNGASRPIDGLGAAACPGD
ncbi:hypothetical protein [Pseudomonas aeruginosa]|uniref:hypothetical protein n=1 Tax=Pseudomonas aeruginosa TaxID=287 RepID=UPI003D7F4006